MAVATENLDDAQVLLHHYGSEIDEGNVRFVVLLLPHFPSAAELD